MMENPASGERRSHQSQYHESQPGGNNGDANRFHGRADPDHSISRERPWHRQAADLALAGYTASEIGEMLGKHRRSVDRAVSQPYQQARMIEESKKTARQDIQAFLEKEVMPSLETLVAVRNDASARSSDRLAAANSILDRFLGKPTQPIETNAKPPEEMSDLELKAQILREINDTSAGVPRTDGGEGELS